MKHSYVLTFLSAAIFLIVRTGNTLLGSALEAPPQVRLAVPATAVPSARAGVTDLGRLFGLSGSVDETPPLPDVVTPPNMQIHLLAVLVSDEEALSTGFVIDDRRVAWLVRTGDRIGDMTVEEISRDPFRVVVWNPALQRREYIIGIGERSAAPPPFVATVDGVKTVDATHHVITRARVDATLGNLGGLAGDAQWIPLSRDGRTIGWQVRGMRAGSILEAIGLRSGDTVLRVNGLDLGSPDSALEAYQRLKNAVALEVDLERGGSPVRMSLRVDN